MCVWYASIRTLIDNRIIDMRIGRPKTHREEKLIIVGKLTQLHGDAFEIEVVKKMRHPVLQTKLVFQVAYVMRFT